MLIGSINPCPWWCVDVGSFCDQIISQGHFLRFLWFEIWLRSRLGKLFSLQNIMIAVHWNQQFIFDSIGRRFELWSIFQYIKVICHKGGHKVTIFTTSTSKVLVSCSKQIWFWCWEGSVLTIYLFQINGVLPFWWIWFLMSGLPGEMSKALDNLPQPDLGCFVVANNHGILKIKPYKQNWSKFIIYNPPERSSGGFKRKRPKSWQWKQKQWKPK